VLAMPDPRPMGPDPASPGRLARQRVGSCLLAVDRAIGGRLLKGLADGCSGVWSVASGAIASSAADLLVLACRLGSESREKYQLVSCWMAMLLLVAGIFLLELC